MLQVTMSRRKSGCDWQLLHKWLGYTDMYGGMVDPVTLSPS